MTYAERKNKIDTCKFCTKSIDDCLDCPVRLNLPIKERIE